MSLYLNEKILQPDLEINFLQALSCHDIMNCIVSLGVLVFLSEILVFVCRAGGEAGGADRKVRECAEEFYEYC